MLNIETFTISNIKRHLLVQIFVTYFFPSYIKYSDFKWRGFLLVVLCIKTVCRVGKTSFFMVSFCDI